MSEQASFQRSDTQRKGDDTTKQIYAISAPKILLETLTARSTTLIFAITYIAFVVGFSTDINLAYRGFTSLDTNLLGVGNNQNFWNGTITSLSNVIAISLSVQQTNFSNVFLNNVSSAASIYDAQIWACYLPDGCGRNFAYNGRHDGPNYWHEVLSTKSQSINIPSASVQDSTVKRMLVPPTFQNQESIPARGKVRSYFISVNYTDNPEGLFSSSAALSTEPSTIYTINILARSGSTVISGTFSIILLIIVSITLTSFIHVMNRQKKEWLTEQKWVCYYLSALILFINPIYCVIVWQDNVSPMVVFAYYFVDAMAQASFLVVWLLFADNIGRKAVSPLHFYGPKILLGFSIFTTTIVALVYQFPSVSPTSSVNSDRSPVQAVSNWSLELQRSFSGVSITVLILMIIWTVYWLTTLVLTGRKLRSLPYMSTRYLQLSYRFFLLQAYLLAAYFVFQHYFVIFFLLREAATGRIPTIVELTDYLNTLSRQQTQQYGKVIFLTVYALLITYLFLPASLVDNDLATALASTYVLTEKEGKVVVKSRRASISNISSAVAGAVKKIVDTKAEVFCVETAIAFCNISYETYYDPANLKTGSAYDIKNMDIKKYGYKLVCTIYRPENETFCVIARHETLNKLVVGFRGSTCTKHWTLNLKGDQCALHLPLLDELDKIDGLGTDGVDCVDRIYPNHSATAIDPHRSTVNGLFRNVDMEQPSEREPTFIRPSSLTQNALSGKSASLWSIPVPKHTSLLRATSCNTWKSDISGRDEDLDSIDGDDADEDDDPEGDDAEEDSRRVRRFSVPATNRMSISRHLSFFKSEHVTERSRRTLGGVETSAASNQIADMWRGANEFISTGKNTLGRNMSHVASTVVGATSNVVGGATDLVVGVAAITPGIKSLVLPQIHSGLSEAYAGVRYELHEILRRELKERPAHLYFTGHSLGGAWASLAALDASIHIVPRVNAFLLNERNIARKRRHNDKRNAVTEPPRRAGPIAPLADTRRWQSFSRLAVRKESVPAAIPSPPCKPATIDDHQPKETGAGPDISVPDGTELRAVASKNRQGVRKVKVSMYNYGTPRLGNPSFAQLYNRIVPDSFRTVVDGDLMVIFPIFKHYCQIGTQVVVDNLGSGSIIIDPSFIERRLRIKTNSHLSYHSLLVYRKGLTGVKDAGEFMKEHAKEFQMDTDKIDVVRLALNATAIARNNSQSFAKMLFIKQKKMKPKINMSRVSIESPMFLEEEEEEEDFIPPSGGSEPSDIGKLTPGYPLAKPCLSDSNVPHGPLFAPLSEDSPVEMTRQPNVDNGPVSLQLREPESLRPAIDTLGTIFEESDPSPSADAGYCRDLDYLEAAHYANDLVNNQNIIDSMQPSIIHPRDLFRMVTSRAPSLSDFFTARPHTHGADSNSDSIATVGGAIVAADV